MRYISFRSISFYIGVCVVIALSAMVLPFAYSFVGPLQAPGTGYGPDTGVVGKPDDGISQAVPAVDNLFKGQRKIYEEVVARCSASPPTNPTVAVNATPLSGNRPLLVFFAGAGNDASGTITSFSWDFGDAGSSALQSPSHTYASAGNYTAQLTVSDDEGNLVNATIPITVTNSPVTFTCADVVNNLNGSCANLAGGFKLTSATGLTWNGYGFDDNNPEAGNIQPRNVCILARYGNQPASIPVVPNVSSYARAIGSEMTHWTGLCNPGACPDCLNDHLVVQGEDFSHFDVGIECNLEPGDTDPGWTQLECYF